MIDTIEKDNLTSRAAALSAHMVARLRDRLTKREGTECTVVNDIRSKGLMIGIELERPCTQLVGKALDQGLLINVTADRVIRLLPPLILTDQEADQITDAVAELIIAFARDSGE